MNLTTVGLNHKTAPVDVREGLAFDENEIHPVLRRLDRKQLIREGVLLSTCNRTELYMLPGQALSEPIEAVDQLCGYRDIELETVDPYLYEYEQLRSVEHCFEVAASLNSMVVGETQILGQVKDAYAIARQGGFCGKYLHQLFQESFRLAKRIRNETNLHRLPTSVGSCAVALASQIFGDLSSKSILVIGSGKMSRRCLDHLTGEGARSIKVVNRTLSRAKELAQQYNGSAHDLDQLDGLLPETDIIISSTGASEPIIERSKLDSLHRKQGTRPLFIIDIAVPRDVNKDVGQLENVYLYDIDSLKQIGERNLSYREQEVDRARSIVKEGVEKYEDWLKTQDTAPLIKNLKQEVYQLVESELREHLPPEMDNYTRSDLQLAAHRITNKLLDDPVNVIKEKAIDQETDSLRTVREMFDLDTGS